MNEHDWSDWQKSQSDQSDAFTERTRTNGEQERNDPLSCKTIDALLAHAFGHSPEAAKLSRNIAVALQQWPNKTDAGKACERPLLLQDIDALSEMMGVRS